MSETHPHAAAADRWRRPATTGRDVLGRSLSAVVRRHPLSSFVVLACAFSWWMVPIAGAPLGSGPFLAAVLVLWVTVGVAGIRDLLSRMVRWRVHWAWYAVAIGFPTVLAVLAAVLTVGLGAAAPTSAALGTWTEVLPTFVIVLVVPLFGPWEEPGFRGFLLSGLQRRWSPLVAGLTVGVVHVIWHTPLFFLGDIPASDVVFILAASIVFAWLVIGSGGSVLLAMLMHAANNAVSGEYVSSLFTGDDATLLGWVRALLWCVVAGVVVVVAGRRFRDPDPLPDDVPAQADDVVVRTGQSAPPDPAPTTKR
jgi:membrane protease YdiL (CAAX protease family)